MPSATTEPVPVIVEFAATGVPAVKVTAPPVTEIGEVIDRVLTSAVLEARVQVETPIGLVAEHVL